MRPSSLLAGGALVLALCGPLTAAGAEGSAPLADAEAAYAEVDYEATQRLASAALTRGHNSSATTLRLLVLLGIAAAALDQPELARSSFRKALANDPNLKLDQQLSPKLRGPYLEAKGELARLPGSEALAVELEADGRSLQLQFKDPL